MRKKKKESTKNMSSEKKRTKTSHKKTLDERNEEKQIEPIIPHSLMKLEALFNKIL